MLRFQIGEYEWKEKSTGDFILVCPDDADTKLDDLRSISISRNRKDCWQIVLGSYPYGLLVDMGNYDEPETAMVGFKFLLYGGSVKVAFCKPEEF